MEINACFWKKEPFHFQPVSFSFELSPCRSPCPLATDVLSELFFCRSAIFFFFTLNWSAKWERKRKGKKKINNKKKSSISIWASMRLSLKRAAQEWDQTVHSHVWSSAVQSPHRGEWGRTIGKGGVLEGYADTELWPSKSCPVFMKEARRAANYESPAVSLLFHSLCHLNIFNSPQLGVHWRTALNNLKDMSNDEME